MAEAALLPRVPGKAAESRRDLLLGEQQQPGAAPGARPGRAEGLPSRYRAQTGGAAGLPLAGSRRAVGGRCGVLGGPRRSWSGLCSVTPSTATGVGGRPRTASTEPRRVRRGGGAGRQRARGPPGGACHCSPGTERARPAPRAPRPGPGPGAGPAAFHSFPSRRRAEPLALAGSCPPYAGAAGRRAGSAGGARSGELDQPGTGVAAVCDRERKKQRSRLLNRR